MLTVRPRPAFDDAALRRALTATEGRPLRNSSALAYAVLDHVVDAYFDVSDEIEARIEAIDERVWDGLTSDDLARAFALRRDLVRFRRVVAPLRELLTIVVRRERGVFDDTMDQHLRDLYDHVVTVHEEIEMSRDLLASALDGHLSVVSNKMNETVLKVSAWAAIIAVPTVIASIYGMNFVDMPELQLERRVPGRSHPHGGGSRRSRTPRSNGADGSEASEHRSRPAAPAHRPAEVAGSAAVETLDLVDRPAQIGVGAVRARGDAPDRVAGADLVHDGLDGARGRRHAHSEPHREGDHEDDDDEAHEPAPPRAPRGGAGSAPGSGPVSRTVGAGGAHAGPSRTHALPSPGRRGRTPSNSDPHSEQRTTTRPLKRSAATLSAVAPHQRQRTGPPSRATASASSTASASVG